MTDSLRQNKFAINMLIAFAVFLNGIAPLSVVAKEFYASDDATAESLFGDKIFIYVSKIKKFSDVREVISGELYDTPPNYNYDREFTKCMKTKSIEILDKEDWLEFSKIVTELEVFTRSSSPYNKLLNAPIKLDYNDQQILNEYFKI